jgi:integrase
MQARYQYGSLRLRVRMKGPNVWEFRWLENGKPKSMLIGTLEKLPTKADAERAVEHLRIRVNAEIPQRQFHSVTVGALVDRFMEEYAPKHCRLNTRRNYRSVFNTHVKPKWGNEFIHCVKTMAVQNWLDEYPPSRQVKSHIRRYMHILFNVAIRWEILERNPIDLVRQPSKRLKAPSSLTPEQFRSLLGQLAEPHITMVVTIACLGLRACELLALQWGDIDFENLTVRIQRSIVAGEVNPAKSDASEATLPLDPDLAETLLQHKARVTHTGNSDYVFAGKNGKPPRKDGILADHLKPAALRAGIGNLGWHTFRRTYSTLLHALGTAPVVQEELLRHADIRTTLDIYTRAVSKEKREAVTKVTRALRGE